jgi:CHASE2 domain-containing sensor protein/tRNA A-37 threonylcarbamoyl transferase component Bud32
MSTEADFQPKKKPAPIDSEQTLADTSHDRIGIDGSPLVKKADRIKSRRKRFGFRPLIFGILSGGLAIVMCAVCAHRQWFTVIDRTIADQWTRLRGTLPPHPNIILITADESSQEGFNKQWPWPRSIHAKLIDNLTAAGAKVIGMDLLFLEDSTATEDNELAAALQRSGRVVLGSILHQQTTADHEAGVAADSIRLIRPLSQLLDHAQTGFVNVEASPDGVVRAFPLVHPDFDIEAFDLVILRNYLDITGPLSVDEASYRIGPVRIPQPDDGLLEFRYTGRPGTYQRFSYFDVVDTERLNLLKEHVSFDKLLRNSIVLVGCTLVDQKDYFEHPFGSREKISGLEVHANILQAMLEAGFIERAPLYLVYTLVIVLGFSTVMATLWVRTWLAIAITVVVLAGFTAVCYFAYVGMNMVIPWSYPALSIVLGYLVTGSSLRLRIKLAEMWGPYQLLDELGEGGMATVYRARNKKTRDIVALKVMLPHLASQGNTTRRFIREIAAASRLDHPNVVRIVDVGEVGGQPYAAMELVDGVDLQKYIDKAAPLSPAEAIPLAIQAADGLHAAHVMGIVHRDVKPSNFMLNKDGCLKIMDFGLAIATDQTQFTLTGSVLGTPDFMSPEQCRGEHVDERADIYSFGALLYMMLTGKKLFTGETSFALVQKHLNEAPASLATHVPGLPEELDQIVQKCLAKDPKDRYQTIHEVRDALQAVMRTVESKPA